MILYRIFPHNVRAAPHDEGGALCIPPSRGAGRIDNPSLYATFYACLAPAGAVAEVLGRLPAWYAEDLVHVNGNPLAIATYEFSGKILELDTISALLELGIDRPSHIVTPERSTTRAWAARAFRLGVYDGVSWWSPYSSRWTNVGIWSHGGIALTGDPDPLRLDHSALVEAARVITRQFIR